MNDKNLEELAVESRARVVRKIAWPFLLPASMYQVLRQKAALSGVSISDKTAQLMLSGIKHVKFPQLPDGAFVRLAGSGNSTPTRYSLPLELAEKIQSIQKLGYSNAYICVKLIEKGLELDRDPERGPSVRAGTLAQPTKDGVDEGTGGDELPPGETNGSSTVR